MSATPLSPSTTRYTAPGVRQYVILDTAVDIAALTRVEIDAGTDITSEVVAGSVQGFEVNYDATDAGDAGSKFTAQIRGRGKVDVSSVSIYLSEDTDDARATFAEGSRKIFVIFPEGDHDAITGPPAKTFKYDAFPVEILSAPISSDGEGAGQFKLSMSVHSEPALNKDVPASS